MRALPPSLLPPLQYAALAVAALALIGLRRLLTWSLLFLALALITVLGLGGYWIMHAIGILL